MIPAVTGVDPWTPGPGVLELDAPAAGPDPWLRELPEDELVRHLETGPVARRLPSLVRNPADWARVRRQAFDRRRGSWQVLCPLSADSVVVDLDAGLGVVARALATSARFVLAVDDVRSRLLVADALNREQGVDNVRLVCGDWRAAASWATEPVSGVWLGRRLEEVAGAQRLEALRALRGTLRDGGWLALTARNGRELRRLLRPGAPREPGVRDWVALLEDAGFEDVQVYAAAPDRDHASTLVPLAPDGDTSAALRDYGVRKRWKLALLSTPALRPHVVVDLLLVARAGRVRPPRWLLADGDGPLRVRKLYLSAAKASVWYRDGRAERIREVALDRAAAEAFGRVEAIAEAWQGRADTPAFFDGRRIATDGTRTWMDRPIVRGTPLADWSRGTPPLRDVCRRLRTFAEIGPRVALPVLDRRHVVDHFLDANANARHRIDPGFARRLRAVADALARRRPGGATRLMHGDFTPNNVLLDGERVEPIDWDVAVPVDFAGYDLLNLLWYRHCGPHPDAGVWARAIDDCADGRVDAETAGWIAEACGDADPVDVLATFVLLRLARGTTFGDEWIAAHGLPALTRAEEWLSLPDPRG